MDNLRYIDRLGRGFPLLYREARRLGAELQVDKVGDVLRIILMLNPFTQTLKGANSTPYETSNTNKKGTSWIAA